MANQIMNSPNPILFNLTDYSKRMHAYRVPEFDKFDKPKFLSNQDALDAMEKIKGFRTEHVQYTTHTIHIPVILIRVLFIALVFVIVSIVRYCCWLCKRKHTTTAANNLRNNNNNNHRLPTTASVTPPDTIYSTYPSPYSAASTTTLPSSSIAPPIVRPIIGGRRSSHLRNSASVFSLGAGPRLSSPPQLQHVAYDTNDRLTEALVARDRHGMNSMANPWVRGSLAGLIPRTVGDTAAGAASRALAEDDRLELGIRAIGGNTELTNGQPYRDRSIDNVTNDNGDLALLTHLMALDIIYHSDNNNTSGHNPIIVEKPPDYEQCLLDLTGNVKLTDTADDLQPPTYDTVCHVERQPTAPTDGNGTVTSVTDANCQTATDSIRV